MPRSSEVISEAEAARKLINAIIEDTSTPSDNVALARIDSRIDSLMSEFPPLSETGVGGAAFSP